MLLFVFRQASAALQEQAGCRGDVVLPFDRDGTKLYQLLQSSVGAQVLVEDERGRSVELSTDDVEFLLRPASDQGKRVTWYAEIMWSARLAQQGCDRASREQRRERLATPLPRQAIPSRIVRSGEASLTGSLGSRY